MKTRVYPQSSRNRNEDWRREDRHGGDGSSNCCCCENASGLTKLVLTLSVVGILILLALSLLIPLIFILQLNSGTTSTTTTSSLLPVGNPKRLAVYYGYPSLVSNVQGNLTAAIGIFGQFDLIVFGNGISSPNHSDHTNTQTIIQGLTNLGKLSFGYVDLGVSTSNLNISTMQTSVSNWAAMGVQGIMWDDAGYDYGVNRSRQTTMISYCHGLNLRVMMNAWNPDDVLAGSPMVLTSTDLYLSESYLISNNVYQNLTLWKIKAEKCLSYSQALGISIATLSTSTTPISSTFDSTQQFSQAWFGTALYDFDYFQATDIQYSSSNNILYSFSNPLSFYGNTWQTTTVQTDSQTHSYRLSDTGTIQIFGDGATYGSGNYSPTSTG